jgi:hypothetical protein
LNKITFAAGSQLQYIRSEAFSDCPLNGVVVPESIVEIDPSAFDNDVWRKLVSPLFLIDDHFIRSVDSRLIFRSLSPERWVLVGSDVEVIGANAFGQTTVCEVLFESGSRLREIGAKAFEGCLELKTFNMPESVEILSEHCFEDCFPLKTINFVGSSRLKRIGEQAFASCDLHSITIPASTEEIDGSAFAGCPLITIGIAPENLNFKIQGNMLVTSNGKEIVRCFGLDREIVIGKRVQVLRKSCFAKCKHIDRIDFEIGSELQRIDRAALRRCESLARSEIPASVTIIEDYSFEWCCELEACSISQDSSLITIGAGAFAHCTSLRSFNVPQLVESIGKNCFSECIHLYRLRFGSSESLKTVIGDRSLDDALYEFGVSINSSLFRIDIVDGGLESFWSGWISVLGGEADLQLSLV